MRDWAEGIQSRNYGIRRKTDPRNLSELLCTIASLVLVAGALLFYAWVRSRIVEIGYEEQRLQAQEKAALRTQANLILEEQTLKNPERIDGIAQNELGMMPVRTNQLVEPQPQDSQADGSTDLAMANSARATNEPRKPAPTN